MVNELQWAQGLEPGRSAWPWEGGELDGSGNGVLGFRSNATVVRLHLKDETKFKKKHRDSWLEKGWPAFLG